MPQLDYLTLKNKVKKAKPGERIPVGKGLFVLVQSQTNSWQVCYKIKNGKEDRWVIGSYEGLSLSNAKARCAEIKMLASKGINPRAHFKIKGEDSDEEVDRLTLGYHVNSVIDARRPGGSQPVSQDRLHTLESVRDNQLKSILSMNCTDLHIVDLELIIKDSIKHGWKRFDDTLCLLNLALKNFKSEMNIAPPDVVSFFKEKYKGKKPKSKPARFLLKNQLSLFAEAVADYNSFVGAAAMLWTAHSMTRTIETLRCRKGDVCFKTGYWTIEEVKTGVKHVVPLTVHHRDIYDAIIQRYPNLKDSDCLFQAQVKGSKNDYITGDTLRQYLNRNGLSKMLTLHGLRSTASTALNNERIEVGGVKFRRWDKDAVEKQLAHVTSDTRAKYNFAEHLEEREEMLAHWGDILADAGVNIHSWLNKPRLSSNRQTPLTTEAKVVEYAIANPTIGCVKIAETMELGINAVKGILRRNKLNTRQLRLASAAQP